jgi:hypothetical protein
MGFVLFTTVPQRLYMKYEVLCPAHRSFADHSGNILGSKLCTGAPIRPNFFCFSFYSFWIFSFSYSLLFLLSFSISSYPSLLILLFLSLLILLIGAILRFLILLLLYFQLFVVVRHVTGNDKDYLRKIPRVVV